MPFQNQDFHFEKGYSGTILSINTQLISQIKNRMIKLVLDQEFMYSMMNNYWSLKTSSDSYKLIKDKLSSDDELNEGE